MECLNKQFAQLSLNNKNKIIKISKMAKIHKMNNKLILILQKKSSCYIINSNDPIYWIY